MGHSDGETIPGWGAVARSPDRMLCLALLLQPKHISRMQEPESTPTTPLSSRASLRRFPFWGSMARLSVIHIRVFSLITSTLPTFAWALSSRARTSPLDSFASVCYDLTLQHIYRRAQLPRNECADHAAAIGAFGSVSNQNIHTRLMHSSFDSTSLFAPCDNLGDVLHFFTRCYVCLLHNAWSEAGDLFHTVSLFGLSRFRPCFLVGSLICCLAQSIQTPICGGKPCSTMEPLCASSASSCSSLLTTLDFDFFLFDPLRPMSVQQTVKTQQRIHQRVSQGRLDNKQRDVEETSLREETPRISSPRARKNNIHTYNM